MSEDASRKSEVATLAEALRSNGALSQLFGYPPIALPGVEMVKIVVDGVPRVERVGALPAWGGFREQGRFYEEVSLASQGSIMGLYDWLRRKDGAIVGYRFSFHDRTEKRIATGTHVEREAGELYTFYFGRDRAVDESRSMVQLPGYVRLFRAGEGQVVLLVEGTQLDEADLLDLQIATASSA